MWWLVDIIYTEKVSPHNKGLDRLGRGVANMMLEQIEPGQGQGQVYIGPDLSTVRICCSKSCRYKTSFCSVDHQLETETSLQSILSSSGGFVRKKPR